MVSSFAKWQEGKIGIAERNNVVSNIMYPSIMLCMRPNGSMIRKETEGYETKFPTPKKMGDMLDSFQYSSVIENK